MEKIILVEFGKRLKALRRGKKLKQTDMAELMGITDRQYQCYEYGKVNVPATALNFFADYFDVTTDYLLGRGEKHDGEEAAVDINYPMELGKRLKALREAKDLTQREMADVMGVKLCQYQCYEYGEIGAPLEVLNFFADYFGVTADYLLGREEKHDETKEK